ncbi:MAG: DNA repair protein RecO [Eubacteriales bacterium]|nr:DNA repair protein RecO [Eubacteriales bacterium]MDY3332975.1 DNA repair protein RecO [Gallibacter sp.]
MNVETDAIVLKSINTASTRKIIVLFTKKFGKISAGTSLYKDSKNKNSLLIKPFTYGNYNLYKKNDFYSINKGEIKSNFFSIGEDIDKYLIACKVLEITEKILVDEDAQPKVFNLLYDFLTIISQRKKRFEALLIVYIIKLLSELGYAPQLDNCVECGRDDNHTYFDIKAGGIVCADCNSVDSLIFKLEKSIIDILKFLINTPIQRLVKIDISDEIVKNIMEILEAYILYHLDIKLKLTEISI